MSAVPLIFTSGWASGINAYAVVLVLGLFGRFGHVSAVPVTLERADVLALAGALFLCEFVADKIPFLDTLWNIAHTVVRPVLGGAIGALMAHHAHGSLTWATISSALGGGTALISHLAKAGVRIGVNASPEPASNIIISAAEDVVVAAVVGFALLHPLAAALIATAFLALSLLVVALVASRIRSYWRNRRARSQPTRFGRRPRTVPPQGPFMAARASLNALPETSAASHAASAQEHLRWEETNDESWPAPPESWPDDNWR